MANLLGAHVSASEGVHQALTRIKAAGGTAVAFFLKNDRRWTSKPYEQATIDKFHENSKNLSYDGLKCMLPHGSYLINLANPDDEKRAKGFDAFLDDLKRCEQLGVGRYNFHPGSSVGSLKADAIPRIAKEINKAHAETKYVKVVLENMTGNKDRVVGTELEDLRGIIDLVNDKSRVGVCIDTCHSFAAGYDLRTEETFKEFWDKFDKIIGYEYLSGIHLNDSKHPFDSGRDVHQNIGLGFLGLEPFRLVMNKKELDEVPKVLETPFDAKAGRTPEEIELLFSLVGKSKDDILDQAKELSLRGEKERNEVLKSYEKKDTKKSRNSSSQAKLKQTSLKKFKKETKAEEVKEE